MQIWGGKLPEIYILMSIPVDSYLKFKANVLMAGPFPVLIIKSADERHSLF